LLCAKDIGRHILRNSRFSRIKPVNSLMDGSLLKTSLNESYWLPRKNLTTTLDQPSRGATREGIKVDSYSNSVLNENPKYKKYRAGGNVGTPSLVCLICLAFHIPYKSVTIIFRIDCTDQGCLESIVRPLLKSSPWIPWLTIHSHGKLLYLSFLASMIQNIPSSTKKRRRLRRHLNKGANLAHMRYTIFLNSTGA
jgi:hypothetical protein